MSVEELKYTKEHEWIRVEGDTAIIGITDYAQGELGDVVFVELPLVGTKVNQTQPFGTIEAVKTVADLFAPVSGEVVEVNSAIESTPAVVNSDPYSAGWLIKIKMANKSELESLLSHNQYLLLIKS